MAKHSLVLVNRSFWPDVEATGQFYAQLSRALVKNMSVTVIAGRSYYVDHAPLPGLLWSHETIDGVTVIRVKNCRFSKKNVAGRFLNWFSYGICAFIALLRVRATIAIIGTDPPFLGIIALCIRRLRGLPFIYHCMDLYPDVAVVLGKLHKNNVFVRLFDFLNRRAFAAARLIVCLGASAKQRIKEKGIADAQLAVIPLWVDTSTIKPVSAKSNELLDRFSLRGRFVVMYSGNIGLSQDLECLLEVFTRLKDAAPMTMVFVGDGALKGHLQAQVLERKLGNVIFLPYQPLSLLPLSLGMADIHLVTLAQGMAGARVPSKLYGILAAAKPYVAITDEASEPAVLARTYDCGMWVSPGDIEGIVEKLLWAFQHQDQLRQMGERGRQLACEQFDHVAVLDRWRKTLEQYGV